MMNVDTIKKLFDVVRRKNLFDQQSEWSKGSSTYLDEIRKELAEVEEEISAGRICYLEDELGDVLWDYLNLLLCLEEEKKISVAAVFERSLTKYEERISGIEAGLPWVETKAKQQRRLAEEYRDA